MIVRQRHDLEPVGKKGLGDHPDHALVHPHGAIVLALDLHGISLDAGESAVERSRIAAPVLLLRKLHEPDCGSKSLLRTPFCAA